MSTSCGWEGKGRYGSFHLRMKCRVCRYSCYTLTTRAVPEHLRDASCGGAVQIAVPLPFTMRGSALVRHTGLAHGIAYNLLFIFPCSKWKMTQPSVTGFGTRGDLWISWFGVDFEYKRSKVKISLLKNLPMQKVKNDRTFSYFSSVQFFALPVFHSLFHPILLSSISIPLVPVSPERKIVEIITNSVKTFSRCRKLLALVPVVTYPMVWGWFLIQNVKGQDLMAQKCACLFL